MLGDFLSSLFQVHGIPQATTVPYLHDEDKCQLKIFIVMLHLSSLMQFKTAKSGSKARTQLGSSAPISADISRL
jgi:hypothetical protein